MGKYCECFQAGVRCTDICRCDGCRNLDDYGPPGLGNKAGQQQLTPAAMPKLISAATPRILSGGVMRGAAVPTGSGGMTASGRKLVPGLTPLRSGRGETSYVSPCFRMGSLLDRESDLTPQEPVASTRLCGESPPASAAAKVAAAAAAAALPPLSTAFFRI